MRLTARADFTIFDTPGLELEQMDLSDDGNVIVGRRLMAGGSDGFKVRFWRDTNGFVEDLGSINGTYADHRYDRQKQVNLMHGGEVQLGELRLKLVSFGRNSERHERARSYLAKRDGLTGLLSRDQVLRHLGEEASLSETVDAPLTLVRYELRGPPPVSDQPTIIEMLALRRAATRVFELTDALLHSLVAVPVVTAGRTGPLRFVVAMVGPGRQESRNIVEQVVWQVCNTLPDGLDLAASIVRYEPGVSVRSLIDP